MTNPDHPIWICRHVQDGATVARVTNISGFIYGDCGRESHFDDLIRHGSTRPVRIDHMPPGVAMIADVLPPCASAFLDGDDWVLESFRNAEEPQPGSLCCRTTDDMLAIEPALFDPGPRYMYFSVDGLLAIRNRDGTRNVPFWCANHLETGKRMQSHFPGDTLEQVDGKAFQNLLEDCQHNVIMFMTVNF